MDMNYCIVISSCEAFSDLWTQHILLLKQHWIGDLPEVFLVTDRKTDRSFDDVNILVCDGDMPLRIKEACSALKYDYVLLTLDDYFLIENTTQENISKLVEIADRNKIDYLRIYDRRYTKSKYFSDVSTISKISLDEKYAVSLYPAIWRIQFLRMCIKEDESPWEFEPKLTEKARTLSANCYYNNSGSFQILDVVRKGKVLHKAHNYFKKNNINIGNRPLVSWKVELKQMIADVIWWYMPRWVYRFARRAAELFGMKFYSEK